MGSALAGRNYDMEKDTEVTINEQDQKEEIKKVKKKRQRSEFVVEARLPRSPRTNKDAEYDHMRSTLERNMPE